MWTPVRTDDGSWTLRHPVHGEACHSMSGAWTQARERYAQPCRLRELARERHVVQLLDIGTGLGLNLAAALEAVTLAGGTLRATTLEVNVDLLRAALDLEDWPEDAARWIEPVHRSLRACWAGETPNLELTLLVGDARDTLATIETPPFDAVFLDPFSPRIEPDLWREPFLRTVAARVAPHAVLSTYSASLDVRAALARAGWNVGRGPRVGTKSEGTLASFETTLPALDPRTQRKLLRRCAQDGS